MAIGSPCFMSRFSNLAFHFFQSPLVSASPSPALPKAKKTTTTTLAAKSEKELKKKKDNGAFAGSRIGYIFPLPLQLFCKGVGRPTQAKRNVQLSTKEGDENHYFHAANILRRFSNTEITMK